jgi:hypothetical protein
MAYNKAIHNARNRLWRKENPEKVRAYNQMYSQLHPIVPGESYRKNRKRYIDYTTAYIKNNPVKHSYWYLKSNSKRRKIHFDLSFEDYIKIRLQPCFYCGKQPLSHNQGWLDRINNDLGYILTNVLPCCGPCNKHRYIGWTVEEMIAATQAIIKLRKEYDV